MDKNKGEASTSLWSKCQSLFQPLTFYFPAHSAFVLGEQWWQFNRAAFGRSANLCNAYGDEDSGDNDDGDIDEGHDDVWYSIEQHLKGLHKSAEGTSAAVIGMECRKAKRENRQDPQLTFG